MAPGQSHPQKRREAHKQSLRFRRRRAGVDAVWGDYTLHIYYYR